MKVAEAQDLLAGLGPGGRARLMEKLEQSLLEWTVWLRAAQSDIREGGDDDAATDAVDAVIVIELIRFAMEQLEPDVSVQ